MTELLTVKEVAALARLSTRQIHKLVAAGRLPAPLKIARSTRFRATDIQAWIESGCAMEPRNAGEGQ